MQPLPDRLVLARVDRQREVELRGGEERLVEAAPVFVIIGAGLRRQVQHEFAAPLPEVDVGSGVDEALGQFPVSGAEALVGSQQHGQCRLALLHGGGISAVGDELACVPKNRT